MKRRFSRKFNSQNIIVQVTENELLLDRHGSEKPLHIPFDEIEKIFFTQWENIQFAVKTKDGKVIRTDAYMIEDIKKLITLLRKEHPDKVASNLTYEFYKSAVSFAHANLIYIAVMFILLIVVFMWALAGKEYHTSRYFDEKKSIAFSSKSGIVCPRYYRSINKEEQGRLVYRYECVWFGHGFLLFEKSLENNRTKPFFDDDTEPFTFQELVRFWFSSKTKAQ